MICRFRCGVVWCGVALVVPAVVVCCQQELAWVVQNRLSRKKQHNLVSMLQKVLEPADIEDISMACDFNTTSWCLRSGEACNNQGSHIIVLGCVQQRALAALKICFACADAWQSCKQSWSSCKICKQIACMKFYDCDQCKLKWLICFLNLPIKNDTADETFQGRRTDHSVSCLDSSWPAYFQERFKKGSEKWHGMVFIYFPFANVS